MQEKPLTKEQEHELNQVKFKKTPQEKEIAKAAKSAWKKSQKKNEQTKG
jgi:hypothetical protein